MLIYHQTHRKTWSLRHPEVILNQEDEPVGLEEEEVVSVVPSSAPVADPGRVEVEPF